MSQIKNKFLLILFFNICFINASTRVSFSRPGEMMRIPGVDYSISRKLLTNKFVEVPIRVKVPPKIAA